MLTCPQCHRTENQVDFTWGNRAVAVTSRHLDGEPYVGWHRVCDDCDDPAGRPHPTCCDVGMRRIIKRDAQWRIDPLPEAIVACPWCRAELSI